MIIASTGRKGLLQYKMRLVVKKSRHLLLNVCFFYLFDFTTLAAIKKTLNN